MQISNIIGKQIFSPTGELLGVCLNAYVARDLSKLTALSCADSEDEEFCLPTRAIRSTQDAIIATPLRMYAPKGIPAPIGKSVYSPSGELLGAVCDLILDEQSSLLVHKDGKKQVYPIAHVVAGKKITIYPSAQHSPLAKPSSTKKHLKKATRVAVREPQPPTVSDATEKPDITNTPPIVTPLHRLDLLGRTVKKSVFTTDGTLLIAAGERVTNQLLAKARRHNRLLQLTVNTLTNLP